MKTALTSYRTYVLAAAAVLAAASAASGQQYGQQTAMQQRAGMWYNPQNETTVQGKIHAVKYEWNENLGKGTHVIVRADNDVLHDVYLGPRDYLQQNNIEVNRGDEIQFTGARWTWDERTVVLAREMNYGGRTVALRGPEGTPVWAGGQVTTPQPAPSAERAAPGQVMGAPMYDTASETTIRGTVEQVKVFSRPGMKASTHAIVRTPEGQRITVQLAPRSYLSQQNLVLNKGDQVEITGSRVKFGDDEAILARELRAGSRTYTLRSADGTPQWRETGQADREMYPQVQDRDRAERMETGVEYDRTTETTLEGSLQDIRVYDRPDTQPSTHATLRTDDGRTVTVLLGPADYLQQRGLQLRQGDRVRVIGSRIQFEGQDTLVARELSRGGTSVMLRDESGQPQWSTTPGAAPQQHEQYHEQQQPR